MLTIDERIMALHRKAAYYQGLGVPDMAKLAEDIEKALVDIEKARFEIEMTVMRLQMELEMQKRKLEFELEIKLREIEIMALAIPETPDTDEPPAQEEVPEAEPALAQR